MKVYIVTRHHSEPGFDSFKTAAFTTLKKAQERMRESFRTAVACFKSMGLLDGAEDVDTFCDDDRAWIVLSHNDRNERQWHITESELDDGGFSDSASLD